MYAWLPSRAMNGAIAFGSSMEVVVHVPSPSVTE